MTVRDAIYASMKESFLTIQSIGAVVEPGQEQALFTSVLMNPNEPRHVVSLKFDRDRVNDDQPINVVQKNFRVVAEVLLSPQLVQSEENAEAAAGRVYTDVLALYGGRAPEDGTWSGNALRTEDLGGGGVYFDDDEVMFTFFELEVTYRHKPGVP